MSTSPGPEGILVPPLAMFLTMDLVSMVVGCRRQAGTLILSWVILVMMDLCLNLPPVVRPATAVSVLQCFQHNLVGGQGVLGSQPDDKERHSGVEDNSPTDHSDLLHNSV